MVAIILRDVLNDDATPGDYVLKHCEYDDKVILKYRAIGAE